MIRFLKETILTRQYKKTEDIYVFLLVKLLDIVVSVISPRIEHPNPQWERKTWRNLNGIWEFEFDFGCSAIERNLWKKEKFDLEIMVPF